MDVVLTFNLTNEIVRLVKCVVITPLLTSCKEIAPSQRRPQGALEFIPLRRRIYYLPMHCRCMRPSFLRGFPKFLQLWKYFPFSRHLTQSLVHGVCSINNWFQYHLCKSNIKSVFSLSRNYLTFYLS